MEKLIDGKLISKALIEEISNETKEFVANGGKKPHLAAILVGNDGASETYVNSKIKMCLEVGFESSVIRCTSTITEEQLLKKIEKLNTKHMPKLYANFYSRRFDERNLALSIK